MALLMLVDVRDGGCVRCWKYYSGREEVTRVG